MTERRILKRLEVTHRAEPDLLGRWRTASRERRFVGRARIGVSEDWRGFMVGFRDRLCRGLWVVLIGSQILGCGNPYRLATVTGRVTCQGKPAVGGQVVFEPIDAPEQTGRPRGQSGRPSRGTVDADGTFTLTCDLIADGKPGESAPGALVGPHRVRFLMPRTTRPKMDADTRALLSGAELAAAEHALARVPVYAPLPCGNQVTPGEVVVKPGSNEFEFQLQPK